MSNVYQEINEAAGGDSVAEARNDPMRSRVESRLVMAAAGTPVPDHAAGGYYEEAVRLWGRVHLKGPGDVLRIGPIGSRSDAVLFWRSGRRVKTGCFEGPLDAFAGKIEEDYGRRLDEPHMSELRDQHLRWRADYRALVQFLRGIS